MGWFSSEESDHEKQLETQYAQVIALSGMPERAARQMVREMIQKAKQDAKQEGTKLPPNFGDVLLATEHTDARTRQLLAEKRREGVKDLDIRRWWNLPDLDRRMCHAMDEHMKMAGVFGGVEQGLSPDEAIDKIMKILPVYGDPRDTSKLTGANRPLPFELRDRVTTWQETRRLIDAAGFKRDRDAASSFNALVRMAISKGEL